ncbi:MAG: hypothetical protein Ct9H300mP28_35980 [Pseudomonadota bacterium]|nr:MAG: hypothetical protein Ct9H300mP28_35980 [Pseudomonadota bacterium]
MLKREKIDMMIDFITTSNSQLKIYKPPEIPENSQNIIFGGMRKKNEGNSLQKMQYKEMSFSCASMIWIRFQGTFSGGFKIFLKPPPLTKLFQFIAIVRNVKQNKVYKKRGVYFFCFFSNKLFQRREKVQSLNGSNLTLTI